MGSDLPRVIYLPRKDPSDDQKNFLLVHVASTGASPLDLKLIGTDESDVFAVSCKLVPGSTTRPGPLDLTFMRSYGTNLFIVKQNGILKLKNKRSSASPEEWEQILAFILLGGEQSEAAQGVEAIAEVEGEGEGSELKIRIRKQIEGGITVRLHPSLYVTS